MVMQLIHVHVYEFFFTCLIVLCYNKEASYVTAQETPVTLTFNANKSFAGSDQYCEQGEDIYCTYIENEFHPIFSLQDTTNNSTRVYVGVYTMRITAGGSSPTSLTYFNPEDNIERYVWAPLAVDQTSNTLFNTSEDGIAWVCSSSYCGNGVPLPGMGSAQHYFLLQASVDNFHYNVSSSFNLTVQFMLQVHGIGMGTVGKIFSFLLSTVFLLLILAAGFIPWHWKLKILYWRDLMIERAKNRQQEVTRRMRIMIKKHRATVKATKSLEGHISTSLREEINKELQ